MVIKTTQEKLSRFRIKQQHRLLKSYEIFPPDRTRLQDQVAMTVASEFGGWITGCRFFQSFVEQITRRLSA